jgi:hypothetical protein
VTIELLDSRLNVLRTAKVDRSGIDVKAMTTPQGRIAVRVSWAAGNTAKLYALYLAP